MNLYLFFFPQPPLIGLYDLLRAIVVVKKGDQ